MPTSSRGTTASVTFASARSAQSGTSTVTRECPVLKHRTSYLPQRCRDCRFFGMCNGNLRARAEYATGDFLGMDPSCYLTADETAGQAVAAV